MSTVAVGMQVRVAAADRLLAGMKTDKVAAADMKPAGDIRPAWEPEHRDTAAVADTE